MTDCIARTGRAMAMPMIAAALLATSAAAQLADKAEVPPPASAPVSPATARTFANGFPTDPAFFPIGVWLQNPRNAAFYRGIGINTYVGLWKGPNESQMNELAKAGMHVIAEQGELSAGLSPEHRALVKAWMQVDEPDNARPEFKHARCLMPHEIVERYRELRAADPTRPIFLNFGQGLANRGWGGRSSVCKRMDHDAYYGAAVAGGDILAFDIYPASEGRQPAVQGKLELVGEGIASLRRWGAPDQSVWSFVGTTHVKDPLNRPSAEQVRAMVWMSIVNGARGIVYFMHEWQPSFKEDATLRYPEIVAEMARVNAEIARLAPLINAAEEASGVKVRSGDGVRLMTRRSGSDTYAFAVNMTSRPVRLEIETGPTASTQAVVLGEDRSRAVSSGLLSDDLKPYGVGLYRW